MASNTFKGRLVEFPDIAVDKFNIDARLYLLTHCHTDHLVGIKNKSFQSRIYCSDLTKRMLALAPENKPFLPLLKAKQFNDPFKVTINHTDIKITLIPAYHCPGSTMFLIESDKNVLVTGDLRAESWFVSSLKKNPYLFPYTSGLKTLDNVYLDTTFAYRGEPYIEIPENHEGIHAALKLLQMYPRDDPDIQFFFKDFTLGFEEAWACLIPALDGTAHVSDDLEKRHNLITNDNYMVPYGDILLTFGTSGSGARFHLCPGQCNTRPKFPVEVKQCINFNVIDFVTLLLPVNLKRLTDSDLELITVIDKTSKGYEIVGYKERTWIKVNDELLPSSVKLIFSRHSSYSECVRLIGKLKPKQVYPLSTYKNSWESRFVMSRLFGHVCELNDLNNFVYDIINSSFKPIQDDLLNAPVKTINRWSFQECENELRFVDNWMYAPEELKLYGRIPFNEEYQQRSSNDVKVSEIISERNNQKFQQFIKQSEYLYKKFIKLQLPGSRPTRQDYMAQIQKLEDNFLDANSYSFLSIEDLDYHLRKSLSTNSSETEIKPETKTVVSEEFGLATKIPTIKDASNDNIMSSVNSMEISYHQTTGKRITDDEIDEVTVNIISKKLRQDPSIYFSFQLRSTT